MSAAPLLALRAVSRTFTVRRGLFAEPALLTAVNAVDLDIAAGEPLGLVGESGCGKSTLGRIAAGLLAPTSGEVHLYAADAGHRSATAFPPTQTPDTDKAACPDVASAPNAVFPDAGSPDVTGTPSNSATPRSADSPSTPDSAGNVDLAASTTGLYHNTRHAMRSGRVQMIFQDPFSSLNPRMTIGASIAEPLTIQGVPKAERRRRTDALLELVGLSSAQAMRFPHEFSGGQRQRIAVARALITHPQLIVCDEPVSALDASVQAQVLNVLRDIQERFNPAYLFISHDLAVVGFVCRRIAVMYLGGIMEVGPRDALLRQPAHPYTQALLAAMPRHDPDQRGHAALRGELPSPLAPPAGCPFHPRCTQALPRCATTPPPWVPIGHAHKARCHLLG